jgi:hypothetical protein
MLSDTTLQGADNGIQHLNSLDCTFSTAYIKIKHSTTFPPKQVSLHDDYFHWHQTWMKTK